MRAPMSAASIVGRDRDPYPVPAQGAPMRLAFVGQSTFFEACAADEHSGRLRTVFLEFRAGGDAEAMRARIDAFAPHVVVAFRPEVLPPGVFAGLRAAVLGFLTEPIPRTPGRRSHPDL